MPEYFLGVDGGQSSTTAIIGDENGRVVGIGTRRTVQSRGRSRKGRAKFVARLQSSLQAACAQAGLNAASVRFTSACLGFSGGPADKESILAEILASDRTLVTDDAFIALAGATAGEPGLVVIAGTGSIAFGRNAGGRTARAGGWGYIFGDEGGGFWIARQAIRAALRFEEGWGVPTSLRARLLDAVIAQNARVRNMNDLLHRCYTPEFPRPRIAEPFHIGQPCRRERRSGGSGNPGYRGPRTGFVGGCRARTIVRNRGPGTDYLLRRRIRQPDSSSPFPPPDCVRGRYPGDASGFFHRRASRWSITRGLSRGKSARRPTGFPVPPLLKYFSCPDQPFSCTPTRVRFLESWVWIIDKSREGKLYQWLGLGETKKRLKWRALRVPHFPGPRSMRLL